ncbi:MAG: ATP-binding protein [Vicinamibacterales bacterium]
MAAVFPRSSLRARLIAVLLAVAAIAVCTGLLSVIPGISAGAAAPVLLLAVLLLARSLGTGPALVGALCATLSFSYFFIPPVGLFVENPDDWIALITFSLTALVVGELAAGAERRRVALEDGKREIEQLYAQLGAAFERASEAEAARRNEQLKSALLDALTHNLRTPLTAIKASVTAMLSSGNVDVTSLTTANRRELLLVIDEEADRLNRFIEALSGADRPDPAQPGTFRAVDVDHLVREAVARAETVARHHHVRVTIEPHMPQLAVDRSAIGEAIYTLIDNASKYSPLNSTITVRASSSDQRHVRLAIEDEGPGIPVELREQVFQKFFRIPGRESVDPRRRGIGLGLPIAKRLVESQAGRITIETPASGRGTSIVLVLPCVTEESDSNNTVQTPPAELHA